MKTLNESNWKVGRLLAIGVGIVALILLASVLSSSLLDGSGGQLILGGLVVDSFANPSFAPPPPPVYVLRIVQVITALLWLGALFYAIRYPVRFISILVLLTVFIIILSMYLDDLYEKGLANTQETAIIVEVEPELLVSPPSELVPQPQVPDDLPLIFRAALVGGVTLGALYVSKRLYDYYDFGRDDPKYSDHPPDIKQDALDAIAGIESGKNFRNVIEECYAKMINRISESSTASMRKTMTPREFETVLLHLSYPKNSVERLTRLFENTRYGKADPTERERREAVACLQQIADAPIVTG